jgi:hypothetical protein
MQKMAFLTESLPCLPPGLVVALAVQVLYGEPFSAPLVL